MATGALFGSPVFQFVDPNGVPYAGGSLAFYATGSTTPLAIYADIALTTPLQNPVPLNSGGFAPQIFLQDLEYAAVLSDVYGNQIWTADPVTGTGGFTTTVVVTGSQSIGFQATNTSADGQSWALLSNSDGSLSVANKTADETSMSISADGQVFLLAGIVATSPSDVGDTFTCTAALGQSWGWASLTSGVFQLTNNSAAVASMQFYPSGSGVMPFDMTFESTVEVAGLATLTGGVDIEDDPLVVTSNATFFGVSAFNGTVNMSAGLTCTTTATFGGLVSFTGGGNVVSAGPQSVGFEVVNTGPSGRSWAWVSAANGHFQAFDFTAAASRADFSPSGQLALMEPPILPSFALASLPAATGLSIGSVAFASDGRNTGEAAGSGSGCLVQVQSKAGVLTWCAVWSGVAVTA